MRINKNKMRTFRLRPQLDGQLAAAAERSGRTVSGEIEWRLECSFPENAPLMEQLQMLYQNRGTPASPFMPSPVAPQSYSHWGIHG